LEMKRSQPAPSRFQTIAKIVLVFLIIYVFMFSITLMGKSFKMLGKDFAEGLLNTTSNEFVGLFIGILATSIVQSSSTVTSITVGLVAGGGLTIPSAIPIVMGANIGTSVTNILVSLSHVTRRDEFRRAFSGAVVHDIFNLLAVLVLFPLELATHILARSATFLGQLFENAGGLKTVKPIGAITEPLIDACKWVVSVLLSLPEFAGGVVLVVLALVLLFGSLTLLVKVLHSLMLSSLEAFFSKYLFRNAPIAFCLGMVATALVQSSSVTTSLVVPLVGAGVLSVEQIFPYTLGANVGTTVTAILASLATGNVMAVTVAFSHLLFNIFGIALWYPFRVVPISIAKGLGERSAESRWFPFLYIGVAFFLIPILLIVISKTL
jgi:sodium-dependent phosphate cotransporter